MKKLVDLQKGEAKRHPDQEMVATVVKLFKDQDYGILKTVEGREIYFHRNSVVEDDFDRIELGTGVQYEKTLGNEGPQATTVRIVDKPGSRMK